MKNLPQTPEEKRRDTSVPGREEEVIVNSQEQQQLTNNEYDNKQETLIAPQTASNKTEPGATGERAFKEGLANNSDTES